MKTLYKNSLFTIIFLAVICVAVSCKKQSLEQARTQSNHYSLGIEAYKAGRYYQALQYFEKALEFEPDNPELYLNLAIIYDDCLKNPYPEQHKQDKIRAIEYYEKYLLKSSDSLKKTKAKKWLLTCRQELTSLDANIPPEDLKVKDAIDKEKALEILGSRNEEIVQKYSSQVQMIHKLQSEIGELQKTNKILKENIQQSESGRKPLSVFSWILSAILFIAVIALAYALKTTPAIPKEEETQKIPEDLIPEEKIIGSYIWIESVHNRGMMVISKDEKGIFVETRAINTDAVSSGHGKYSENILEATLKDDGGDGVLIRFEFHEDGRAFVASWDDELGHGSAVGLRNEFDEIIRHENQGKPSNA